MPDLLTQFDRDLNQNVVLVRNSPSNPYDKYIFDEKSNGFMKAPEVVKVVDLTPLYESKCDQHGSVFFCRNSAKNQRIFKYTFDSSTNQIHRVQCQCCEWDTSKEGKYFYDGVEFPGSFRYLPHAMNVSRVYQIEPEEMVDEDSSNYLWIRPYRSDTCMVTSEIIVFAEIYPKTKMAFNFDLKTQKFNPSECNCTKCIQIPTESNVFDTQGIGFQRTHRDHHGTPLIPLAMTWKNQYEGAIEHFSDSQGHIGKYKYNSEMKCFEVAEFFNVRVEPEPKKSHPKLLYDDDLEVVYFSKCHQLNRPFFFGDRKNDTVRKYTFNELTHQFEIFECSDCWFNTRTMRENKTKEIEVECKVTGKRIQLSCDTMGRIVKKMMDGNVGRVMERAPIKNRMYWDEKKLAAHYATLNTTTILPTSPVQIFLPDGTEKWLTNGYHKEEFVLLMGMNGALNPYKVKVSRMGTLEYVLTDQFGVEIPNGVKENQVPFQPSLPLDSCLLPPQSSSTIRISNYTYCTHHKSTLFFTDNNQQLLLTKYHLIEVRCQECVPQESKIVNGAHIAFENGFAWRIDVRRNGNFVQKMMYLDESKEWDVMQEYQVRMMKTGKEGFAIQGTVRQPSLCPISTAIVEKSEILASSSEIVKDSPDDADSEEDSESDEEDEEDLESDEEDEEDSESDVSDEEDEDGDSDEDDEDVIDRQVPHVIQNAASDSESCDDEEESDESDEDEKDSDSGPTPTPLKTLPAPEFTENSKKFAGFNFEDELKVPRSKMSHFEDQGTNEDHMTPRAGEDTFSTIPLESSDGDRTIEDREDDDHEYSHVEEEENACSQIPDSIWDNPPTGTCTIS